MPKALEISRKIPLRSIVQQKTNNEFIWSTIENKNKIHESPGRKPDWEFAKS